MWYFLKIWKVKASKITKIADFDLPKLSNLILRKIWVSESENLGILNTFNCGIFSINQDSGPSNWQKLSTSIYDLVLLYVCHFHHHYHLIVSQIWPLSRYSCCYLGSLHPRNFCCFIPPKIGKNDFSLKSGCLKSQMWKLQISLPSTVCSAASNFTNFFFLLHLGIGKCNAQ